MSGDVAATTATANANSVRTVQLWRAVPLAIVALLTLVAVAVRGDVAPHAATTRPRTVVPKTKGLAIRVSGRSLVDEHGSVVQLRGVNRAGTEYRCVQDIPYGFVTDDNSTDGTSARYAGEVVAALQTWNKPGSAGNAINAVRIPLNEQCWFGHRGAAPAFSGAPYRAFIKAEVDALVAAGMYPILDLHWTATGSALAAQQDVAPNVERSLPFWTDVAKMFKHSPAVVFDLFNEPRLWCYSAACSDNYATAASYAWGCFRDGCTYTRSPGDGVEDQTSGQFEVVGTQRLVNAIRDQGADNVILIEGLGYSNALDNWAKYKPIDPSNQIAAELHTYSSSGTSVNNVSHLDRMLSTDGLTSDYPLLVGEFGESICSGQGTGFAEKTMAWADSHGYGYTAWAWDKGEGCSGPSLVTSNAGAVSPYGAIVRAHLRRLEDER